MNIIIANIISLVACTLMMLIGLIKEKKRILMAQCAQFTLMGVSHFLLGGNGGVIACTVSILRNLVFFKFKSSKWLKIGFIVLQLALSASTITLNPITWLPSLATAMFTWVVDTEDIIKFKRVMIITIVMWLIYDAVHLNFVSAAFDAFTIISTGYSMWQIKKGGEKAQ